MDFKYFTNESGVYKFKAQTLFKFIICFLLFGLVIAGWLLKATVISWLFGILLIMVVITIFVDKFEIDTNRKIINVKQGIMMQGGEVSFERIINFEMLTTTTNFIRSSVQLNLYYFNDKGKEKVVKVAVGMSKKHMQNILNEIDEILENDESKR